VRRLIEPDEELDHNEVQPTRGIFIRQKASRRVFTPSPRQTLGRRPMASKKQAERYGEDEQKLQALEHQTDEKPRDSEGHEHLHHILTVAVTLLHVAIAIATIAIIVRGQRWPWYGCGRLNRRGSTQGSCRKT
jgi:hypothetical protein